MKKFANLKGAKTLAKNALVDIKGGGKWLEPFDGLNDGCAPGMGCYEYSSGDDKVIPGKKGCFYAHPTYGCPSGSYENKPAHCCWNGGNSGPGIP
ncbi:hypothetical protein [Aureibacter tunicatorum]|uniref:Uncharacterized protein n=1 Tax=Aureibacter tunicatorum TaxID=866807 RepID=A0AAE3XSX0_9BACT|nr:hypothetical protein [Aureibacter tunicatorum]MDR6241410.1 hypothetical protein [Aureibacter tunicatorum]BDD06745.1 hypothetical protein AUTU_42280 [Aureibacter tunicatorum]